MKKIFFFLTVLISTNVFGEWILVASHSAAGDIYIDSRTISKEGSMVKAWLKTNYRPSLAKHAKSMRIYAEYDCRNRTSKTLSITSFSDFDFLGENLGTFTPSPKIEYIAPDTLDEKALNYVCN